MPRAVGAMQDDKLDYPNANSATRGCLRSQSQQLMIEGSSDKLRDAWIGKSIIRRLSSLTRFVFLRSASGCTTNAGGRIKSERIAIADASCVFSTDTVGTETIAEGRS